MQCTSYYREDATLTYEEYKDMTNVILNQYPNYQWELLKVRKLKFVGNYDLESSQQVSYVISMKNQDEKQLYLEKKTAQSGRYLKSCAPLTREEVEKIMADDVLWMQGHKNPLFADFYLHKTLNALVVGPLTDYEREVIQIGKKGYIIFNKSVLRDTVVSQDFFRQMHYPIPCVGLQEVHYTYKQKASIPVVLSHMLQQQEGLYDQVAMCL